MSHEAYWIERIYRLLLKHRKPSRPKPPKKKPKTK
jgi:hypothetical protein